MTLKPTYIKRLDSGYWHVRFGPQQFVQWPIGGPLDPTEHVFGGETAGATKENLMTAAWNAVAALAKRTDL